MYNTQKYEIFFKSRDFITFAKNKVFNNMVITDAWMVIVNPKAGSGRGLKDWPTISNQMYSSGLHFTCLFTEHKYHATELTVKAINDGYRNIVAVGGDGTIH